jgi:DNA-binding transcriptional ArsR family regulator
MKLLSEILSSKIRAEIFRLLFGPADRELHVREIERQTGLTIGTVRQELKKLEGLDLITARRDGNRLYYRANKEHPLYAGIHSLVLKTSGLVEVFREALAREGVRFAFVFGSIASDEANARSDVDLMVIGDVGLRNLSGWLSGIPDKIGREVNPYVLTEKELLKRKKAHEHFLMSVLDSPKLFIIGTEDELGEMGG